MKFKALSLNSRRIFTGAVTRRPGNSAASVGMCGCLCCCKDTGGR